MILKNWALLFIPFLICSCHNNVTDNEDLLQNEVNIMTFNVRYDNPEDGMNAWKNRVKYIAPTIRFYDVDVLGTQEVLHNQLVDMKAELPEYEAIGVGREDGKTKGEYSAIWYKSSRFSLQKYGYFWLSETPDTPGSKGWDAACERIATWVILKDTTNGKDLFVLNTHLDHVGQTARREGVALILKKVDSLCNNMPVIVMGDFNSTPESSVIAQIKSQENTVRLYDTREISPIVYGPSWSFHDFGNLAYKDRPLFDYIFVDKQVEVIKYGVISESFGDVYLSDHCPIFTAVRIKN